MPQPDIRPGARPVLEYHDCDDPITDVESEFRARVAAMSPAERIRRAEELFRWSRDWIVRSIRAPGVHVPEKVLRRQLALRLYGADPRFRRLLEELSGLERLLDQMLGETDEIAP